MKKKAKGLLRVALIVTIVVIVFLLFFIWNMRLGTEADKGNEDISNARNNFNRFFMMNSFGIFFYFKSKSFLVSVKLPLCSL